MKRIWKFFAVSLQLFCKFTIIQKLKSWFQEDHSASSLEGLKLKEETIPTTNKDPERLEISHQLLGRSTSISLWERVWQYPPKSFMLYDPESPILGVHSPQNECLCSRKDLYMKGHSCIILNSILWTELFPPPQKKFHRLKL